MNVLFGLASLAALSVFWGWLLRRPAALMPILSVSCAMLFFTAAGCLGLLAPAGYAWYALCAAAFILACAKLRGRLASHITPAFVFFVAGGVLLVVLFSVTRPMLTLWDEFTFWGTAGKVTQNAGQLYTTARSSLIARTYPPGLIVFSYMMQFFGGFTEHGFIAVFGIVYLACFAAAASVWGKNRSAAVVFLAAMAVLPLLFETRPAQMLYAWLGCMADMPMSVLFGGALCFYYAGAEKSARLMLPFALILAALACVKDMGLALALCALLVAGLDMALCERERLRFGRLRRGGALAAAMGAGLVAIAASYAGWALHLRYAVAVNRFDVGSKGVSLGQVEMLVTGAKMLLGYDRSEQFTTVLGGMLRALYSERVFILGSGAVALCVILAVSAAAFVLGATKRQRRRVVVFTLSMAACFAAFYVFNIFTYALIFQPSEAEILRDYARYISPFWLAWLMGALLQLARCATYHKATFYRQRMARAVCAALCVVLVGGVMLRGNWQGNFMRVSPALYTRRLDVQKTSRAAAAEGMQSGDNVYIISQGDDGTRFYMLGYELAAVREQMFVGVKRDELGRPAADENGVPVVYGEAASTFVKPNEPHYGGFDLECAPEDFLLYLRVKGCTHVLLDVLDDYIINDFAHLFSDGLAGWGGLARGHSYYRVEWQDETSALLVPEAPRGEGGGL